MSVDTDSSQTEQTRQAHRRLWWSYIFPTTLFYVAIIGAENYFDTLWAKVVGILGFALPPTIYYFKMKALERRGGGEFLREQWRTNRAFGITLFCSTVIPLVLVFALIALLS